MDVGQILEELQLQHLPMGSFVHLIQLFAFNLLSSQLKFQVNYPKYHSSLNLKEDTGVKLCQILLRYLTSRKASEDLQISWVIYTRIVWFLEPQFQSLSFKVVVSAVYQLLDFALKSPMATIKKGLVAETASKVSSKLLQKFSKSSSDCFGDLYKETKEQILSPSFITKVIHLLR